MQTVQIPKMKCTTKEGKGKKQGLSFGAVYTCFLFLIRFGIFWKDF